jgi:hypothetical protein
VSEQEKRLAVQGPKGDRGERGTAGLSKSVRRALVFLFVFAVVLSGLDLFWSAHEANSTRAAIQAQYAREQAAQRAAAAVLGEKLCLTFGKLAALQPPPGNPQANPSRAYLQAQHDTLAQLGTDLGCKQRSTP